MLTTRSASKAKKSPSRVDASFKKNSRRPASKNRLEEDIHRLHSEAEVSVQPRPVKSRGTDNSLLHVKVKELELEVRRLKKATRFPSMTTGVVLTRLDQARTLDRKKIRQASTNISLSRREAMFIF
jgi:hypothetical protein